MKLINDFQGLLKINVNMIFKFHNRLEIKKTRFFNSDFDGISFF